MNYLSGTYDYLASAPLWEFRRLLLGYVGAYLVALVFSWVFYIAGRQYRRWTVERMVSVAFTLAFAAHFIFAAYFAYEKTWDFLFPPAAAQPAAADSTKTAEGIPTANAMQPSTQPDMTNQAPAPVLIDLVPYWLIVLLDLLAGFMIWSAGKSSRLAASPARKESAELALD